MKRQNRVAILNIASIVLQNGIGIITAPLFSRLLGDSGYGVLSIYNIWVSVIAIAFALQTQGTLANARVEYPEEQLPGYQSSVMSLSVLAYLTCGIAVLAFLQPLAELLRLKPFLIVLMLLHGFGTYCINFLTTKFVYEFKAGWNMLISLAVTVVTLGLSLVLVINMPMETRYMGRIIGIGSTYALIGIPACIWIIVKGKRLYSKEYWKFCLALAVPTVFYNLSDLILGQSDQVMLQHMVSEAAVGQYSLALHFGGFMYTIYGALHHTWAPFFFEDMKLAQREGLRDKTKNYLELYTVLSVGFVLLAREVYHVFAREDFWPGTDLIPIFVTSYYINFLSTFPVNYEYFRKKTRAVAVGTVAACLMNLWLNYVLIRAMGMAGAAVATMISHGLQLVFHTVYARFFLGKQDYPFPLSLWGRYLGCYLGIVALVYLSPENWYIRWPLGAVIGLWELWRIKRRKVLI